MTARTLVYKLMVISPIAFISFVSVKARFYNDGFEVPRCTVMEQEAVGAYREPVLLTQRKLNRKFSEIEPDVAREVANVWIQGSEDGKLRQLLPFYYSDSTRDGVKGQIKRTSDLVVAVLNHVSSREAEKGNHFQACNDLLTALRVIEVLKYSDTYTAAVGGIQQRGNLQTLLKLTPRLKPEQQQQVQQKLIELRSNQQNLEHLVRLTRVHYQQHCQTLGKEALAIEDPGPSLTIVAVSSDPAELVLSHLKDPGRSDEAAGLPPFYSELRMGWQSQQNWLDALDAAIEMLKSNAALVAAAPK